MSRQVWKERVYPHLEQHLAQRVDSVTAYLLLYHEVHPMRLFANAICA